ncbi:hypothetical protein OJJOAM_004846 [Cupriavidus sp. H18C1]
MVAECRYAETGVGAAIAWGSQKWNGNCADLVKTASSTSTIIGGYSGCFCTVPALAITSDSSMLPQIWPSSSTPASSASPPPPVIVSAMRAPLRASERYDQKPISRKETMLVNSQNTTSSSRLLDSTTPSIAAMNSSSNAKKRAVDWLRDR